MKRERDREESSATYTQFHLNICRSLFININIAFFYIFTVVRNKYLHKFLYDERTEISLSNGGQTKSSEELWEKPPTRPPPFQMAMKNFTFENRFSIFDLDKFQFFACHLQSPNRPSHWRAGLRKNCIFVHIIVVLRACHPSVLSSLRIIWISVCNNIVNAMFVYRCGSSTVSLWYAIGSSVFALRLRTLAPNEPFRSHDNLDRSFVIVPLVQTKQDFCRLWSRDISKHCDSYGFIYCLLLLRFIYLCTGISSLLFCFHFTSVRCMPYG